MTTQEPYYEGEIPAVAEQSTLDEPKKIRFTGDARLRVRKAIEAAIADGWDDRAVGIRAFDRQKTNIVVKTEDELDAVIGACEKYEGKNHWSKMCGYSVQSAHALDRVLGELRGDEDEPVDTSVEVECDECDRTLATIGGHESTRCICGNLIDL